MAGSYQHVVEHGALLSNEEVNGMLENGGDVYEAVKQMYGMIWYLADALATQVAYQNAPNLSAKSALRAAYVEAAERQYKNGLALSPTITEEND
jgi:hypothetical protein